ncbi:MAG: hypothetical protein DYG90_11805, partial [Chloroflexi bacterium CFX6]|nr:hypothetical protein [Chloroflexi bacterium CFX6]
HRTRCDARPTARHAHVRHGRAGLGHGCNAFLAGISGPLQLHHGTHDRSVPLAYSERLHAQMQAAGRPSELFVYDGDDHNLAGNLRTALQRSVAFFDQHVKGVAAPDG